MQLNNEFVVATTPEATWALLTDLERVAPCMPGAAMVGREGEDFLGTVKIKVGPIGATFSGKARFVEQDDANHRATISMAGKDLKGAASASATIRARLEPVSANATRVYVDTDLDITGRMAQFGRGAIADVSNRLIGQFTANLGALIDAPSGSTGSGSPVSASAAGSTGAAAAYTPVTSTAPEAPAAGLNALSLVGPVFLKQTAVPLAALVLGWLIGRAFPRRQR